MLDLPGWSMAQLGHRSRRLAVCYRVTRLDGRVFRFTTHDRTIKTRPGLPPLELAEYAPASSLSPESARKVAGMESESTSAFGPLDTDAAGISQEDLRIGLFRGAEVLAFTVDWRYPFMGPHSLSRMFVGESSWDGERFNIQMQSVIQQTQVAVGRLFARNCDAQLGDLRCRKDTTAMRSGIQTVLSVSGFDKAHPRLRFRSSMSAAPDHWWSDGKLTWLSGDNAIPGLGPMQVKKSIKTNGEIVFYAPTPYDIKVGDEFDCEPGCEKEIVRDCHEKFGNELEHRGYPLMRGADSILKTPDRESG